MFYVLFQLINILADFALSILLIFGFHMKRNKESLMFSLITLLLLLTLLGGLIYFIYIANKRRDPVAANSL